MTDESEIKSNQSVEDKSTNESSLYRTSGHLTQHTIFLHILFSKVNSFIDSLKEKQNLCDAKKLIIPKKLWGSSFITIRLIKLNCLP